MVMGNGVSGDRGRDIFAQRRKDAKKGKAEKEVGCSFSIVEIDSEKCKKLCAFGSLRGNFSSSRVSVDKMPSGNVENLPLFDQLLAEFGISQFLHGDMLFRCQSCGDPGSLANRHPCALDAQ
jgi:hypothetical protein